MTNKPIPAPLEFLLTIPLYAETVFVGEQAWKIVDLLFFGGTYDSFCTKEINREQTTVFRIGRRMC